MYYVIICVYIIFIIIFIMFLIRDDISSEYDHYYYDKDGNHEYYDRKIIRAKKKK